MEHRAWLLLTLSGCIETGLNQPTENVAEPVDSAAPDTASPEEALPDCDVTLAVAAAVERLEVCEAPDIIVEDAWRMEEEWLDGVPPPGAAGRCDRRGALEPSGLLPPLRGRDGRCHRRRGGRGGGGDLRRCGVCGQRRGGGAVDLRAIPRCQLRPGHQLLSHPDHHLRRPRRRRPRRDHRL